MVFGFVIKMRLLSEGAAEPGAGTVTEPQRERSRLKLDYSHQKRLLRLFDEHSEIFREAALHKKCGVFF